MLDRTIRAQVHIVKMTNKDDIRMDVEHKATKLLGVMVPDQKGLNKSKDGIGIALIIRLKKASFR